MCSATVRAKVHHVPLLRSSEIRHCMIVGYTRGAPPELGKSRMSCVARTADPAEGGIFGARRVLVAAPPVGSAR